MESELSLIGFEEAPELYTNPSSRVIGTTKVLGTPEKQIFIKILNFNAGSLQISEKTKLVAYVGPKHRLLENGLEFQYDEPIGKTWNFGYQDANKSSIVISIHKKNFFGRDSPIGSIELRLGAFEVNAITTYDFVLRAPQVGKFIPTNPTVTLAIHLCENGSEPFSAERAKQLNKNYERIRTNEGKPMYKSPTPPPRISMSDSRSDRYGSFGNFNNPCSGYSK